MLHTMRWFGPDDPVSLSDLAQAGCEGVVTALHHLPNGAVWTAEAIARRQHDIARGQPAARPLPWTVVESLPVHEDIKRGLPTRDALLANYRTSLQNLAAAGVRTVCYNFMPILDWSRTDLAYALPNGARALRFVWEELALFDLHVLCRPGAASDYDEATQTAARHRFAEWPAARTQLLTSNLLRGLPGAEESFTLDAFQTLLDGYRDVDAGRLRDNLAYFLRAVVPTAERLGVRLAVHPDHPPFPLLGLPRVVSTEADLTWLLAAADSPANGFTLCTGSLGVRPDNDLAGLVRRHGARLHFVHLRATRRDGHPRSFYEADHLAGDVDMYAVVSAIVAEEQRRTAAGQPDDRLPMRPDHGHQMVDDLRKMGVNPGYTAIGRLRGLAELRGLEWAVRAAACPAATGHA